MAEWSRGAILFAQIQMQTFPYSRGAEGGGLSRTSSRPLLKVLVPTLWDLPESWKQGLRVCSTEVKTRSLYSPRAFPPGVIVITPPMTDFWQRSLLVHLLASVLGRHAKKADFPPDVTPSLATAEETLSSTDGHVFIGKKHLSVRRLAVYYTSPLLRIVCAGFMSIFAGRCH